MIRMYVNYLLSAVFNRVEDCRKGYTFGEVFQSELNNTQLFSNKEVALFFTTRLLLFKLLYVDKKNIDGCMLFGTCSPEVICYRLWRCANNDR